MTPAEFDAIKARRQSGYPGADLGAYEEPLIADIDALIAEVEKHAALFARLTETAASLNAALETYGWKQSRWQQ